MTSPTIPNNTQTPSSITLEPFPTFDCETEIQSIGPRWTKYMKRFTNFMCATAITDDARKRALLLHYVGEATSDVFDSLPNTGSTYEEAVNAFNRHFVPVVNIEYETYTFRQLKQFEGELLEHYHTRLRKGAVNCNFQNTEREIKSQMIIGCSSGKLRRHALKTPNATLTDLLQFGKAAELSEQHSTEIESALNHQLNWLGPKSRNGKAPSTNSQRNQRWTHQKQGHQDSMASNKVRDTEEPKSERKCMYCGLEWHVNGMKDCKARTIRCNKCSKLGHYARVCLQSRTKQGNPRTKREGEHHNPSTNDQQQPTVATLTCEGESFEGENKFVFFSKVDYSNDKLEEGRIILSVMNSPTTFIIDSGASVDILSVEDFNKITPTPPLTPATKRVFSYGQVTPLNTLGQLETVLTHNKKKCIAKLQVSNAKGPSILSKATSIQLNLIKFINAVNSHGENTRHNIQNYEEYISKLHPQIYDGVGRCQGIQIKLHVDDGVAPVQSRHRRIPFHLRQSVEEELRALELGDIIERVPDGVPTPWVSPLVIVPKKRNTTDIRICVDMRAPNQAIRRERHLTPTLDELLYDLNGAAHFSKLDLRQGYHQLVLDEESRSVTTFTTHLGLFRYKRLSFGINSAAEVFQNTIQNILKDIPRATNISDDILIHGRTKEEHDETLQKTLATLQRRGLTLNKDKCVFNTNNIVFFGHVFSKEGIKADPAKIKEISELPPPTDPAEARSLLGMMTFCSRFLPNLSALSEPIRRLTKKDQPWVWTDEQQRAFEDIIQLLQRDITLAYFDKEAKMEIWTDASPKGIAAILVQRKNNQSRILAFASRTLSGAESRYAQIEREALAIAWAIEHFQLYVYGAAFQVYTDHKPLVPLFNKPRAKLSVRLERWRMKLQNHQFEVLHQQGKSNPADYLSRHPQGDDHKLQNLSAAADKYAHLMAVNAIPKSISMAEIERETKKDAMLQHVIKSLRSHFTKNLPPEIDPNIFTRFHKLRQELATNKDGTALLKGCQLVIPASLQNRIIDIAHEGHGGIEKTKRLLRTKVWFPGIDKKVQEKVQNCLMCQAATVVEHKMPLQTSELPAGPWETLHVDHKGPLPTGDYLLVIVDLYSRFPVVETVRSTGAQENIRKLNNIFDLFGRPLQICTDNGAPFNSADFASFVKGIDIHHRKTTPAWPQGNGEVERFNRTLSKTLKIAFTYKQNWRQELAKMLRLYRATPHSTTKISPAELLFNRSMRIGMPQGPENPQSPTIARERITAPDHKAKQYNKNYHDDANKLMIPLRVGDKVLLKQVPRNKMMTTYDPLPYTVKEVKGSMITSERPGHCVTRNASLFKSIPYIPTGEVYRKLKETLADEIEDCQLTDPLTPETSDNQELIPESSTEVKPTHPALIDEKTPKEIKGGHSLRPRVKPPSRLIQQM